MNEYVKAMYDLIGNRAFFMMGAKNIGYSNEELSLSFKISGSQNYNYIKLVYDYDKDLYNIEFIMLRTVKHAPVRVNEKKYEGLYVDQIHDIIKEETGLRLSL